MKTIKIKQAADYLGLSDYMIRKLCRAKQLPHIKAGGVYLFRTHSLDEWMNKQEQKSLEAVLTSNQSGIQQIVE